MKKPVMEMHLMRRTTGLLKQFNKAPHTKMCILSMDGSPGNEPLCLCHIVCGGTVHTRCSPRARLIRELDL